MTKPLHFGMNLNNREPLIAPQYDIAAMLDLAVECEELGYDSVWVGDSLLSRPRWEPINLLSAISQRTDRVKLGTACMVASVRNPIWLAAEWATLDQISKGRTILGVGVGSNEPSVRREFEALGLPFANRIGLFEECIEIARQLMTDGKVNFDGVHHHLEDVSFYSGTELGPMLPVQRPPPILVVSNPRIKEGFSADVIAARMEKACDRILRLGDGWLTCCRAKHPEEVSEQLSSLRRMASDRGRDPDNLSVAYQVTMHIGDSTVTANADFEEYIASYYPELSKILDLAEWGPVGTVEEIGDWIETFARAGVDTFICRFGAADQAGQAERFAREVMPRFRD
ncbi:MAG: alkanesulfonate monooxygenase SsuD [Planctomycetota bacterium]|jgi:alkanesulfonate monooxygenase SsuD/methylene tetrahydromethanopterin reductase-like flavin-dependent oxidoreductase (luciferase family)